MGRRYTFKCNKRAFEVLTSCGHDYGMHMAVDTYICQSCKKIVDVYIEEYGKFIPLKRLFKERIIQKFRYTAFTTNEVNTPIDYN